MLKHWLQPDWQAPDAVRAIVTTASHGASLGDYAAFNLALHVGDDAAQVKANREYLEQQLGCRTQWLDQVHGNLVVELPQHESTPIADASISRERGLACAILTADCLPVLFASKNADCVAAAHAGWRSLAGGVLENTVQAMDCVPEQIVAWLGPAIGQCCFEIGGEVREAFIAQHSAAITAFIPAQRSGHWYADLYQLARLRLAAVGVHEVSGGGLCTKCDNRFYSYRRQPNTGRFASLIWLAP